MTWQLLQGRESFYCRGEKPNPLGSGNSPTGPKDAAAGQSATPVGAPPQQRLRNQLAGLPRKTLQQNSSLSRAAQLTPNEACSCRARLQVMTPNTTVACDLYPQSIHHNSDGCAASWLAVEPGSGRCAMAFQLLPLQPMLTRYCCTVAAPSPCRLCPGCLCDHDLANHADACHGGLQDQMEKVL